MKAQAKIEREALVKAVNLTSKSKTINLLLYRGLLRERDFFNVNKDIYLNAPRILDNDPRVRIHKRAVRVFESSKIVTMLIPLEPLNETESPTIVSHQPKFKDHKDYESKLIELKQREEAVLKRENELKALTARLELEEEAVLKRENELNALTARLELEENPDSIIIYAPYEDQLM